MKKIYIASDHAGLLLKEKLVKELRTPGFVAHGPYEVVDLGPWSEDSVDYPDFADQVCQKIHGFTLISADQKNESSTSAATDTHLAEAGILICGSGQGMAMRANKYPQIRAALVWSEESARLAREHNDANILVLGARLLDSELCMRIVQMFFTTGFAGGRHANRVLKITKPVIR